MRLTCWHCLSTSSRIFFSQSRTIRLDSDMKISFNTSLYPFSLCASCFTTIRKFWGGIIAAEDKPFWCTVFGPFLWNISQVITTDSLQRGGGILQVLFGKNSVHIQRASWADCANFYADAGVKLMCLWHCFYSLFTSIGPMVDVLPKISFKVIIESLSWEAKLCHVHLVLCNA